MNTETKIDNFNNIKNPFIRFRYWLIEKIVGKTPVIMNTEISIIERQYHHGVAAVSVENCRGLKLCNNKLHCDTKRLIKISSNSI